MSPRRRHGSDRRLAVAFCENARSFHVMARESRERPGGTSAYYFAIAIELGLKAYLLHRGITDQWNRVHIRHDLNKALKCARRAGLKDIPEGISKLAEALSPLYVSGALSRDLAKPFFPLPPDATDNAINGLLDAVETIVGSAGRAD